MFRKDAGAISEWSPENVDICRLRQRRIIADVWPSLNPGGILIYSTCTYNTKEDEENVDWISRELGAESLPVSIKEEWNITGDLSGGSLPVYRFLPHKVSGEGFFMAVLRKTGDETATLPSPKARKDKKPQVPSSAEAAAIRQAKSWLSSPDDYVVSLSGNKVIAAPCIYKAEQDALSRKLRVLQNGILAGELKGKDLIPAHHLGMSDGLSAGAFPRVEVSYEQAISYLRKEVLVFDQSTPRGYVLLLYKGTPLGFVKNIGSRANNLYPQEWRIRSGYLHPHNLFR